MRQDRNMIGGMRRAAVLMTALTVVLLAGCSALRDKPEQTVRAFFGSMQAGTPEQAAAMLTDPQSVPLLLQDPASPTQQGTTALLRLLMSGMDFDIRDVERSDTVAAVEVILSVPDVSGLLMAYFSDTLMLTLVDSGADLREEMQNRLLQHVRAYDPEEAGASRARTIRMQLVLTDGQWLIEDPGPLETALLGGFDSMLPADGTVRHSGR